MDMYKDRKTERQKVRKTDRWTDRQKDRQTNRQNSNITVGKKNLDGLLFLPLFLGRG